MRGAWLAVSAALLAACASSVQAPPGDVQFRFYDVVIDVSDPPLAAYQLELHVTAGEAAIVGIEGGDPSGFQDPPYYDPAALSDGRAVLAAFDAAEPLPAGSHRVATVHVQEIGPAPEYAVRLVVAADDEGQPTRAAVHLIPGGQR